VLCSPDGVVISDSTVLARAKRLFLEDGNPEVASLLRQRHICHEKDKLQVLSSSGDVKKSYVNRQFITFCDLHFAHFFCGLFWIPAPW
jgi:hypothetical protein